MKQIILCANPDKDRDYTLTLRVYRDLEKVGCEPIICPFGGLRRPGPPEGLRVGKIEDCISDADMAVTFGGDGTLLHAARAAAPKGVPVLGVNFGKKGFMTQLSPRNAHLIVQAATGACGIDKRMMLDISVVRGGKEIHTDFSLNDAVIGGIGRVIPVTVMGDGSRFLRYDGDGVVIASPTGSTAYSLSAGGPIVEPEAENIIVTPICAHMLAARSFVLAPGRKVDVELGQLRDKRAYLVCDGGMSFSLHSFDRIRIVRSAYTANFVHVTDTRFYEKISLKLGETT